MPDSLVCAKIPARNSVRNPGIDLLRGISILLVILNHVGLRIRLAKGVLAAFLPRLLLNDLTFNGSEAVNIFFVVSGFLIATNSLERWGSLGTIHLRTFYVRRAARILPCLVALVAILSILHVAHVPDYVIDRPGQSLPKAIASAFGLYLNWFEGHTGYLPANWDVLWSLSIEEVFYLGFPLVCLLLRKDWILAPALAVLALTQPMALASIVGNPIWKEKAYLPGMAAIAAGVLSAIVATRFHLKNKRALLALQIISACGVFAVLGFEDMLWRWIGYGVILMLTFSAACLVVGFHWQARVSPHWSLPATAAIRSFGRLSYEIYLTHMFLVLSLVRLYRWAHTGVRWGFLWYPPVFALAWILGWLVARYYSVPCDKTIRRRLIPKSTKLAGAANNPLPTGS